MNRMLPFRTHPGVTKSEKWVFDQLANDQGLENYVILHSLGLARHRRKSYAECDFVVIGRSGVYCLEVKGGRVVRENGVWLIGWPGATYVSEEGPFKQSQSARGALLQEVRQRLGKEVARRVPFGWGVIFPDIPFAERDPEWDQECIFDERDRESSISVYLARLAKYTLAHESDRGRKFKTPISQSDIEAITNSFRSDFDLAPKISSLMRESRNELLSLSDEQYTYLETILHPGNPRVICEGAAGTGKTVLATEAARRWACQGQQVLFLCFNRNLAWQLLQQEFVVHRNITLKTVWGLLYELVAKAFPEQVKSDTNIDAILDMSEDAAITMTESDELNPYDVLILDEAQDILKPKIMNALDWVVVDSMSEGRWALFLDTAIQAMMYRSLENKLFSHLSSLAVNLRLTINMRNPVTIAREAAVISQTIPPKCRRQLAVPVEYKITQGTKTTHRISVSLLTQLISEGVQPSDIILLSFRTPAVAFFKEGYLSIGKKVQVLDGKQNEVAPDKILASSIPAFKGLESEIVIIGDFPEKKMTEWHTASLYVALTRARTAVYVICSQEQFDRRMKLMED